MTTHQKLLWGGAGFLVIIACGIGLILGIILVRRDTIAPPQPIASPEIIFVPEPATPTPLVIIVPTTTPLPTLPPTAVPTLPPATPPAPAETVTNFDDMAQYAAAIKPILEEGLAAAERDNDVLKTAEQNPAAICGAGLTPHPTLVADAALMENLANRLDSLTPPAEAADSVHKPLVESMRLWSDALNNLNLSCQTDDPTGQGLLRLGAMLQLGGSLLNFQTAAANFWKLAITKGLEEVVGPLPRQ
ncbi:MAG: hypothetical protein JW953_07655 [Anaerolineae bacterium]|nr:hypothetical protein [Anaerolineae bacterium]